MQSFVCPYFGILAELPPFPRKGGEYGGCRPCDPTLGAWPQTPFVKICTVVTAFQKGKDGYIYDRYTMV